MHASARSERLSNSHLVTASQPLRMLACIEHSLSLINPRYLTGRSGPFCPRAYGETVQRRSPSCDSAETDWWGSPPPPPPPPPASECMPPPSTLQAAVCGRGGWGVEAGARETSHRPLDTHAGAARPAKGPH